MIKTIKVLPAWLLFGFITISLIFLFSLPSKVNADETTPAFRIGNVKTQYGHVVVEISHLNSNGTHRYWENYVIRGKEWFKKPRVTNDEGRLLLANNQIAPMQIEERGMFRSYLPDGHDWKYSELPFLEFGSFTSAATITHIQRQNIEWDKGQKRLITFPLDFIGIDPQEIVDESFYTQSDIDGAESLLPLFTPYIGNAYSIVDNVAVLYSGDLPDINMSVGNEYGTVETVYPDPSSRVDGDVIRSLSNTFANLRTGAGTNAIDNGAEMMSLVRTDTVTSKYGNFWRTVTLFDTSPLPDGTTIESATFEFVATATQDQFTESGSLSMVPSNPASNTALASGDFETFGPNGATQTKQAADLTIASITADSATYNSFTLNATGLAAISKTSITKFGTRITFDNDNVEPTWGSLLGARVIIATAEETVAGDKRPRLVVTHAVPSAAITGTIGDGASEQEVRDGNGTIIVTLTGDTWVAAGATFDAQRQNIINGLDAASSPTNGWNNEVRDKINVSSVVRTSDTIATITLTASDVGGYAIDSNEIITVTVPASSLTSGALMTATPTITITAGTESIAMTGTLGGSGGTASEIIAGGQTIILTLTNTKWVLTDDFNAQRQNILDGLVSNKTDQNGWDSLSFNVTDVVRTSDTIVTITLSAESGYSIPEIETISATAPASAIIHGLPLTAPQTFEITPAFKLSGTRVSTAINLQTITNVLYCALGWETTLPSGTTVTIDTSIDGGANYSTAINGNCPAGLTVGESLATITDFRVKATLTTTNPSVTPLITALGLIIEDSGGSELCYQLLTTPSASLADNCGSNTGTMSFPIGPSTITSSTAPITSTADPLPNARALAGQDVAQAVTGSATSAKLFPDASEGGGFTGLPLNDLVNEMSTVGDGLPVRFVWFIFLGIATIGAGMMAVHLTSNLFIAAGAMAAVMGFQMAIGTTGLLPGWILFAFIPLAAAYLLFRRGFPA